MSIVSLPLTLFFAVGYLVIIFESFLRVNKAAVALVMAALCWLLYFIFSEGSLTVMSVHLASVAQIIFFLFGAMVIVELIDTHRGFRLITDILYSSSQRRMLWFLLGLSFFMSAVLDNLTTMIVMVALLRKLVSEKKERWLIGSLLVIAVNAGGAWTPIGDVTTTMLWIGEKISTLETIKRLFLPSLACAVVAGLLGSWLIPNSPRGTKTVLGHLPLEPAAKRVLFLGTAALIAIPLWKAFFGLPPFLGVLLGLGILWLITDIIHFSYGEERWHLRVPQVMARIDISGVFFFLGILLAISALDAADILSHLALRLGEIIPNHNAIGVLLGLISSVIDNVPLVAAVMGMYDFPLDNPFWQLVAYTAGTGGSILIIGSAAGVAFMGLEKVDFIWYLRHTAWIALISYFSGIAIYFLL